MRFKSQVYTAVSGSIGGITYAHNRNGMYARARATPTDPASPAQNVVRAAVAELVNAWTNALTNDQRDGWVAWSLGHPQSGPFGDAEYGTAQNGYVGLNVPRLQAGIARKDDAPTVYSQSVLSPVVFTPDASDDNVSIDFAEGDGWSAETGGYLLIYASRPKNPTVNFFKGPYRYAGKLVGSTTTPLTSPGEIDLPFPVATGQKVFFRARSIRADGRISSHFRDFGIAVA